MCRQRRFFARVQRDACADFVHAAVKVYQRAHSVGVRRTIGILGNKHDYSVGTGHVISIVAKGQRLVVYVDNGKFRCQDTVDDYSFARNNHVSYCLTGSTLFDVTFIVLKAFLRNGGQRGFIRANKRFVQNGNIYGLFHALVTCNQCVGSGGKQIRLSAYHGYIHVDGLPVFGYREQIGGIQRIAREHDFVRSGYNHVRGNGHVVG